MSNKPIYLNNIELKKTILEHLEDERIKDKIESKLVDSVKTNLLVHIHEQSESRLAKIINEMEIASLDEIKPLRLKEFTEKYLKGKIEEDENLKTEYNAFRDTLTDETSINDLLKLDQPIDENPLFVDIVRDSHLYLLLQLTSMKNETNKIDKFLLMSKKSIGLDHRFWKSLKEKKIISNEDHKDVKLTVELSALTLGKLELVKILKTLKIKSLKNLVPYRKEKWFKLFKEHNITPPNCISGENPENTYATYLVESIANKYPTAVFFNRVVTTELRNIETELSTIKGLLKSNPKITLEEKISYESVKWPTDDLQERESIKKCWITLRKLIKVFSHLGLEKIINNPNKEPHKKKEEIEGEIEKINEFYRKNPDLDLQYADFFRNYSSTVSQSSK
ncbi:MAG: hypothetical protein ACFE96_18755, partial [Candidatus Hermodarchaeota archaeon]